MIDLLGFIHRNEVICKKKNEIITPVVFASHQVMLTLCFIACIVMLITPANAYIDAYGYYSNISSITPTNTSLMVGDRVYLQLKNITPDYLNYYCSNAWNASGSSYGYDLDGFIGGQGPYPSSFTITSYSFAGAYAPCVNKTYGRIAYQNGATRLVLANWYNPGKAIGVNSSYTNLTVNVKALGTSTNIYNTLIYVIKSDGSMNVGRTDINGNYTFNFISTSLTPVALDAYAVGYGYYSEQYLLTDTNQFKQIYLTPQGVANSTNYFKVNLLDSLTSQYISDKNANLSITDKNVSQTYYVINNLGSQIVELTGTAKNRPLYYNDNYNVEAVINGYITNNITFKYTSGGQVVDLYLTPSTAYLTPKEMWVDVLDPATGDGNTVGGSTVKLYDAALNQWTNTTTATGQISLTMSGTNKQQPIVIGRNYTLCASATGYSQACIGPFIFASPYSNDNESVGKIPYQIGLTFNGIVPTGNFSCNVYTVDGNSYLAIQNVAILASNGAGQTTSNSGVTQFILPAGTYSFKASKTGYTASTGTITGAAGDVKSVTIPMFQNTITYATTSPTVAPTVTGVYGAVRNSTPSQCGVSDGTIIGYAKAHIACWGANDRYSQDLILACVIIIIFMFFGSRYGKGLGAIIGASAGFAISVGANLIDLWIFFALIILAGLIFGLKLYNADK